MKTKSNIMLSILLIFAMLLSTVPVFNVSASEAEETIKITFEDSSGKNIDVSEDMVNSLLQQLELDMTANKVQHITSQAAINSACTHPTSQQYQDRLFAHVVIRSTECWVYYKNVIK